MGSTFIILGILIFSAHLFSAFFSKRRIPDVLFLVGIGILIGPVLGWVNADMLGGMGSLFASITLVFILVESGVDMHISDLRRYWKGMVQVTLCSFFITMGVVAVMAHYMACVGWVPSLLMGSMVGGTGAAIVIPMIRQMKVSDRTQTVLILESALSGMLCIVVSLSIIDGIEMGQVRFVAVLGKVLASFCMSLLLGIVGGIVWSGLLQRVRKLQNSMFLTPAFIFVIYGITEALGYSGAIAALAFGIVLGNASYFQFSFLRMFYRRSQPRMQSLEAGEKSFFKEMVFILKTFFFVYIGVSIPFTDSVALLYGAIIAVAIFVARLILVQIVGRDNTRIDRWIVSIMMPKGLVSAVLASMLVQVTAKTDSVVIPQAERIVCMIYSIIFFSIVLCSVLTLLSRKRIINTDYHPESEMKEVYDYE